MSPLLSWFDTPEWSRIVETLLHSLWQGAILSAGLLLVLRFVRRPSARYRLALLALMGVVAASLVTWAWLNESMIVTQGNPGGTNGVTVGKLSAPASAVAAGDFPVTSTPQNGMIPPDSNGASNPDGLLVPDAWSAWLALSWIIGTVAMLIRVYGQVSGAERVRRTCRPLTDGPLWELLAQVQKTLGWTRPIRIFVTEELTSPAVAGVLIPVLILPLSLVTTFSPEQLRFILLHELAHIQRRDYLINLFQLMVEALLFFNPAVWWISRQIRLEREACCDAVAVELSGAPVEYARTLLQVATHYLQTDPAASQAFGGTREPSSLSERIQRLLTPGQRPRLRLTWRGMLGSLVAGTVLLVLSALGTRLTMAAILTPEQRMDRIEKSLVENGEDLTPPDNQSPAVNIKFSGRVRTEDGSPLPTEVWIYSLLHAAQNSSFGTCDFMKKDGSFHGSCPPGLLSLSTEVPGYAPCVVGPISIRGTNAVTGLDMLLRRGFAITIRLRDSDSGMPIGNAEVTADFQLPNGSPVDRKLITDVHGDTRLTNCADLPLEITCRPNGYESVQQTFNSLSTNETIALTTGRGLTTSGQIFDKATGQPLAGATVLVLRQAGVGERRFDWDYKPWRLAVSDPAGHFTTTELRQDSQYDLGITLPGRESLVLRSVQAGDSNLVARVGPELIVHGRVTGNLQAALNPAGQPEVRYTVTELTENNRRQYIALAWLTNGEINFEFTNRVAGPVELEVAGLSQQRMVEAPVADWLVALTNTPAKITPPVMREVVIRLESPSGVPPRGTIDVYVPSNPNNPTAGSYDKKVILQNGEARLPFPIGGQVGYALDKTTVGYWFEPSYNWTNVPPGSDPLVIEVPVIPAGVITARARNADGSPAGGLFFSIFVLKPSPGVDNRNFNNYDQGDGFSDAVTPRQYISPPLPLDGKYQIFGWRGNSMCASRPVKLTGAAPDQSVDLQFSPGQDLTGRVLAPDGQPVRGASIGGLAEINGHGFGLKPAFTDAHGEFRLTDCSPDVADYTLDVTKPGFMVEHVKVKFSHLPVTVRLQPGLKLTGKVVEAGTGYTVADVEVRAWKDDGSPPTLTTRTDAAGNFEFNTLARGTYRIFVDGANFGMNYDNEFVAGEVTNLVLQVTPYQGSQLTINRPGN